ncbi:peptidoglycan DD-metalloendopeptidase family protein [Sporosarcina sp. FA9]|uniref:peptidoglycan DD-metalloendopeptidase family protein n=1 Tax=Sporosarcina sp. FA9 TaxID=3413030 RepID=UPI003F65DF22
MREEKPKAPSQKNKSRQRKNWFWPVMYSSMAIVFVGMIWGYNALINVDTPDVKDTAMDNPKPDGLVVETNAQKENIKYPFSEALLDDVEILQEFYDPDASAEMREKALLVFNQTYTTNEGVSISIDGEPFEVVASMSGVIEEIILDPFIGNEIVIAHNDGLKTVYASLTGVLVKPGEEVLQGQALGTATENEWNPTAGIHLHYKVLLNDKIVNPHLYLGF